MRVVLLALLLFPLIAEAGEPASYIPCSYLNGPTLKHVDQQPCVDVGDIRVTLGDDCLATMEAAMRGVDEYVLTFLSKEQRKEPGLVFTSVGLQKFEQAVETWEAAVKQCWRQP